MNKHANKKHPSPVQARSKVIYDSILQAAVHCYEEVGFDSSTTARIAEKAGVGIGSLYRYFPDKDGLLKVIVKKFTEENRAYFVGELNGLKGKPLSIAVDEMMTLSMKHFLSKQRFLVILLTKMLDTSNRDLVFEARQELALKFTESLFNNFPEINQLGISKEILIKDLCQGFHAYIGALFAVIIEGADDASLARLHKNMSNLFKSIVLP